MIETTKGLLIEESDRILMGSMLFEAQNILGDLEHSEVARERLGEILRALVSDLGGVDKLLELGA